MYYQHFGLSGPPFSPAFSATPLFLGTGHREALAALEWGLCEPSGFTLLVGEAGTGKTTLILSLLARHLDGVHAAWVADPKLRFEEMLQVIAGQLNLPTQPIGRFGLLKALDTFVAGLKPQQSVALIFDEVQGLSDELLEELRLLRNVRCASNGRLQIILVGHLDFVSRLGRPQFSQLNQRIGARAILPTLQDNEIRDYLEYRLRAHGGSVDKLFTRGAVRELVRHCGGIPRKINLLCDNSLFGAYAQGARKVSFKHMKVAARDYHNLLWALRDRSLSSAIRDLRRISYGPGLTLGLVSVFGLALFALALCYRFNPVAVGALRLAMHKRFAAVLINRADSVRPDVAALVQHSRQGAKRAAVVSEASHESAPATVPSGPHVSKSSASLIEVVERKAPALASPVFVPPAQAESSEPSPVLAAEAKPAPAAADPAATGDQPAVVVKKGDSLSKIASHYFGSGGPDQVHSLIQANPQITDADRIYPGQVIYVRESPNGNQE